MSGSFVKTVEDLEVFKRAYRVSLEIHKVSLEFPKIEQFGLASQMRGASKSICANLAEGFGKQRMSSLEFKRFLSIAIGSADEMQIWLNYCRDLKYLEIKCAEAYKCEYKEIARMLSGLIKSWK